MDITGTHITDMVTVTMATLITAMGMQDTIQVTVLTIEMYLIIPIEDLPLMLTVEALEAI